MAYSIYIYTTRSRVRKTSVRSAMPRAKLWCFEIGEDNRIYVKHGSNLLKKYGGILKLKLAQEEDKQKDHIKVVTQPLMIDHACTLVCSFYAYPL